MKPALFHPKARAAIQEFPEEIRRELGKAIFDLQKGAVLHLPLSRPMRSLATGAEELRLKDRTGIYRVFYYARHADCVVIFHAFIKKMPQTSTYDIELGRKRLKEILNEEA